MKKQEETRQTELAAKAAEFKAMQAQSETVSLALSLLLRLLYYVYFMDAESSVWFCLIDFSTSWFMCSASTYRVSVYICTQLKAFKVL